jgi:hypothetical protein
MKRTRTWRGSGLRASQQCIVGAVALSTACGLFGCKEKLTGPAPTLEARAGESLVVEPGVVCNEQRSTQVSLHGKGFSPLAVDVPKHARIELPTVTLTRSATLDGEKGDRVELVYGGDEKQGPNAELLAWDSQEQLHVTINQSLEIDGEAGILPLGIYDVHVRNANKRGADLASALVVAPPPAVESVNPKVICRQSASTLTIAGSGFLEINQERPIVKIGGVEVTIDAMTGCREIGISGTDVQMCTGLTISFDSTAIPGGDVDVEVENPASASCSDVARGLLHIEDGNAPVVFFVDPPVAYNGIPLTATIFTSGLSAKAAQVELEHQDGETRTSITDYTSPERPNKILAQVPAGLKAGVWDVVVTNELGCSGRLEDGFSVTSTLNDGLLSAVQPGFASPSEDTALTLTGSGFLALPRVYITPSNSASPPLALRAVELKSGTQLTAVVPSGLKPGAYDLIVVNPNGDVDVLKSGLTVTVDEPPVVTGVTPASLPANASSRPVTITGTGFKSGLTVALDCQTTTGARTAVSTSPATPSADGKSVVTSVTMSNATPSAPDAGSVCLVRLTNADGAFFEYSAFSVTNSSLNLSPWKSASDMTSPRRAPAAVTGRPTTTSRYVYGIGGDVGVSNNARTIGSKVYDTVEAASVDVFGAMGSWREQRNKLPAPRTWSGAVSVGRFVYLLGGHDGTNATSTLYRAQILDPLAGPELVNVNASLGDGTLGLAGGLYYYRVAALFAPNDLENPGGESLPGELLPVQLPERSEKIRLTLSWQPVKGAHGYRLYRSKAPGAAADQLELIGSTTCGTGDALCDCAATPMQCQLADDGQATTAASTPVPEGSLGIWHTVSGARCSSADCQLASAREAHAVTAVQDPAASKKWFLYALGGRTTGGGYLDTYEIATITVAADGTQTVSDFVPGSDTLASPLAELGVWVMRKENAPQITNSDVWLYVGGGRSAANTYSLTLEAGKLAAAGSLETFVATDPLKGSSFAGFGSGASNGQLYTFGGVIGSADGTSASLCDGAGSCAPLPDLRSGAFNALGSAATNRTYMGATQESAFYFLIGGHNGTSTLSTTQQTVQ